MATKKVVCEVLYSGQGMCNLIKVIDAADKVSHLILIDFGATAGTSTVTQKTLPYLVKAVKAHGKIDVLIVSHTDEDHWSFIPSLLNDLGDKIKIDKVGVPIGDWTKKKAELKELLKARVVSLSDFVEFEPAHSGIVNAPALVNWWDKQGVHLNILCASTRRIDASNRASKATIDTNTASVVVRCEFGKNNVVFCADATNFTLKYILKKMGDKKFLGKNLLCTVPHHGALKSLHGQLDTLTDFAEKIKARSILASAEIHASFKHPNAFVLSLMSAEIDPVAMAKEHNLVLYFTKKTPRVNAFYTELLKAAEFVDKNVLLPSYLTFNNTQNLFTTLLDRTTIYPRWLFTMNQDDSTSVEWKSTSAALREPLSQAPPEELAFVVGDRLPPPAIPVTVHSPLLDPRYVTQD